MSRDPRIAAKTRKEAQSFDPDMRPEKPALTREERKHFPSLAERLAQSSVSIGNWKWPEAAQDFRTDLRLASVERYFPYALGGPLLVDLPQYDEDRKACDRKAEVLRKRGYRYVVLYKGIEDYQAQEQLARCMDAPKERATA